MTLPKLLINSAMMVLPALASCAVEMPLTGSVKGRQTGTIQNPEINEASGIVASRHQADVLWIHNDSGSGPVIYALNPQGKCLERFDVTQAQAQDWEDIALGPGPDPGQDYLYIGDIGDNLAKRDFITVYRVPEPAVAQAGPMTQDSTAPAQAIQLAFPDKPKDAESLLVDPHNGDIYIIAKREPFSRVYRAAYPQSLVNTSTMELVAVMPWGFAIAGDISRDGQSVIVRGMFNAALFRRAAHAPLAQAFKAKMIPLPLPPELMAEAICFDAQAQGYYTTREGKNAPIYYFPVPSVTDDETDTSNPKREDGP